MKKTLALLLALFLMLGALTACGGDENDGPAGGKLPDGDSSSDATGDDPVAEDKDWDLLG